MVPEKVGSLTREEDWSSSLKPSTRKIVADPINGYIFWLQSNGQFSSIYLSHLPENDIHPIELVPERIVEDGFEVKTFVVDFEKCRIIFPKVDEAASLTPTRKSSPPRVPPEVTCKTTKLFEVVTVTVSQKTWSCSKITSTSLIMIVFIESIR